MSLVAELKDACEFIYLEDVRKSLGAADKAAGALGPACPSCSSSTSTTRLRPSSCSRQARKATPRASYFSHFNIVANIHQILAHVPEALTPADILFNPLPTFHCFGLTAGAAAAARRG